MCEFLLDKEADINLISIVSETVYLVCRWIWWGRDNSGSLCVWAYVDSHHRFQFILTGLLGKGMAVVCMCVYVGSLLRLQFYRDWFEVDE